MRIDRRFSLEENDWHPNEVKAHQRSWLGLRWLWKSGYPPALKKRTGDGSLFECPIVTDYRTFVDDIYKVLEFAEWVNEKTEEWDSQPFGPVFVTALDTPISSVVTADFLYPTKAKACVRFYLNKHRVNHLDDYPDLNEICSFSHQVNIIQRKERFERGCQDSPKVLQYATPLLGLLKKRKDIIGVMSNLMGCCITLMTYSAKVRTFFISPSISNEIFSTNLMEWLSVIIP